METSLNGNVGTPRANIINKFAAVSYIPSKISCFVTEIVLLCPDFYNDLVYFIATVIYSCKLFTKMI